MQHVHKYDLKVLGVWPVAKRKGLRCASRTIYERTVVKLSRLLQQAQGRGTGGDEGAAQFVGANLRELTILSEPYEPPPPPGGDAGTLARAPATLLPPARAGA